MTNRLVTAREVGELLGVSAETVLRWVRAGKLPAVGLPSGGIRFRQDQLDAWMDKRATPSRGDVTHPAERRPAATISASPIPEVEE
jgi:excisionase family DNA binding protein